jgi:localization factor PodJL
LKDGVRQKRRSYRDDDEDDEDAIGENLAAVNERLDELTRQLERIAHANAGVRQPASGVEAHAPDRVTEALARLDRRLDQIIEDGRTATQQFDRRNRHAPPPPPQQPQQPVPQQPAPAASTGLPNWAAQISARQRALDGDARPAAPPARPQPAVAPPARPQPAMAPSAASQPAVPAPVAPQPAWGPGADIAGLEQQLRDINARIAALHQPYEDGVNVLRGDLAEIGRALHEAMPRRAIEALEQQVRALAERIDHSRQAGADAGALAGVEHGLAEVRDALRSLTPAESLVGFEDAVHGLAYKIDQIASSAQTAQDPVAFKQLEQAVVSLRGVVANVASDGALQQLAAEVHGLAARFEHAAAESSSEALTKLETRIASLMESGRAVPPELEGSIRSLSERLDRLHLSKGDQLALESLEDRIAKLSEKLDASDARLGHLDAIERGLAELLVHLEDMRNRGPRTAATAGAPIAPAAPAVPVAPAPQQPAYAQPPAVFEAPVFQLEPPAPAPPASPRAHPPAPVAMSAPPYRDTAPLPAKAHSFEPRPSDPNLPPDTPLEPGSGAPRLKPGSAAARIAASEAALGIARPGAADTGGKSAAIAAARNAAKSANLDAPAKARPSGGGRMLGWFKRAAKPAPDLPAPDLPATKAPDMPSPRRPERMPEPGLETAATPASRRRVLKFLKTLLIAASVAIIVVGAVQTAVELLLPLREAADGPGGAPAASPPDTAPSRPMPTPDWNMPPPAVPDRGTTGQINAPSFFDPSTVVAPKLPLVDVTGSIPRQPAPPRAPARTPQAGAAAPAGPPSIPAPSASFGPALSSAVSANEPAALYEIGIRHAEGRGVPQNPGEAARWLERAANAGFAPAQFRLAGLHEKGDGLKKDLQAARRLYSAAAAKGHAKAMHNLAVLHAEGIDGKPDYKTAAQWFRKAAGHGIADSQYNLAILYARGIGLEPNLAESYKWFALAAAHGDADAAKKRDEVASRLSQQTLTAAKLAAQTFTPEREPAEATDLKVPPGGWDRGPVPQARASRKLPASPSP